MQNEINRWSIFLVKTKYHFCIMIKDFSISFVRAIIVQDFETVTFYVLFVYKPTFCYFLLNEKGARFKSVQ